MKNEAERIRIGQRIAELRKEKGMSQQVLADQTGLQRPHLTRLEAGKYGVTIDVLSQIANVLGKRVDFV